MTEARVICSECQTDLKITIEPWGSLQAIRIQPCRECLTVNKTEREELRKAGWHEGFEEAKGRIKDAVDVL